jgi:hypothetical protein
MTIDSFTILTIGGTMLWNTEETTSQSVKQLLAENDIAIHSLQKQKQIFLCKVDTEKTNMADFYKWNEVTDSTFCWRTLYTFGQNQRWLPHPTEYISDYTYEEICTMLQSKP